VLAAGTLSLLVSLLSVLGLGGILAGYVGHRLTQRRERAKEDREQALALGDVLGDLTRDLKPFQLIGSQISGGVSELECRKVLEGRLGRLEGIERALHDRALARDVASLMVLIEAACGALVAKGSVHVLPVVRGALLELGKTVRAFVHGDPAPARKLMPIWEEEWRKARTGRTRPLLMAGHAQRDVFASVYARWTRRRLRSVAARRPALARQFKDTTLTAFLDLSALPKTSDVSSGARAQRTIRRRPK
jgi:hypothetical protein